MTTVSSLGDDVASTTEAEQMYLITIAMAAEDGHAGPVPVPRLAERLEVSRVSANEMVKKLADRGLVAYTPYKGAELTDGGAAVARTVLRRRRLWAVFLADHLGMTPEAADAVACEFEHITPMEVAHQLSEFLGDPSVGPSGKPIPAEESDSTHSEIEAVTVAAVPVGRTVRVVRVEGDAPARSFFEGQHIAPGTTVTVVAVGADGGCLLEAQGGQLSLSPEMSKLVFAEA